MATLVLGAVGTLIGGPVGGAIGALIGRQVDGAVLGRGGAREGPRLKDLAITTSSYGQPLPRHFGRMRVGGSVIWATDLAENRETSGGGKGKPKTTTYSYTSSFAVALASRPIERVGRIWADGDLLRGAAGDLKTGGTLRIHTGHGDQLPDPLIASAEGVACPAFRNCAYAVFEDLDLADFGNRIPALTFEVFADTAPVALDALIAPLPAVPTGVSFARMEGYSHEGGSLRGQLEAIDALFPLICDGGGKALSIGLATSAAETAVLLPPAVVGNDRDDFGGEAGFDHDRASPTPVSDALRYYDIERDYQPGLQRSEGAAVTAASRTLEFPAALHADGARALVTLASQRARWTGDRLAWRIAELDPAIRPGALVRAPGIAGVWRVAAWEWRDGAVELELHRLPPAGAFAPPGEIGSPGLPADALPWPTRLRAFELPWNGSGDPSIPAVFAAASAGGESWRGAALHADRAGALVPLGTTGRARSISGALTTPLAGSPALLLERTAALQVELVADDLGFAPATFDALATGANRLLIGGEIVQFARAERVAPQIWRLSGLLRGRGGTEAAAQAGHPLGTAVTLLDDSLVPLTLDGPAGGAIPAIAAIGMAESEPVTAMVESAGTTRMPLTPVHPQAASTSAGALELRWIRRARGAWGWPDGIETPLVEQSERYRVGVGPVGSPVANWEVSEPALVIAPAERAALAAEHPGTAVWVRQLGSFAASDPLHLCNLD
ncbi:phage tail protein [Pelagerythrobacter sp.]|uniref:phage tail protein n=1 Tax=Pelagerythrobacter sp. TaxID=2800702 RepID=UPI0035AF66CD